MTCQRQKSFNGNILNGDKLGADEKDHAEEEARRIENREEE